jgi:Ca-activated chloride channel homolog
VIQFGAIYFAKPIFFWGFPATLLFLFLLMGILTQHQKRVDAFLAPENQKSILVGVDWKKMRRSLIRIALASFFCFLALARPQWGEREEERKTTGLDIFVAVDVSNSMEAEDVIPSRLKRVKYILKLLADRANGDRLGLVAFAGSAQVISPLTTDSDYFRETVESLSPEIVAHQGTDLGAAISTSLQALNRGAEEMGNHENEMQGSRVILLVTDGEDHEDTLKSALEQVTKTGTQLYVFGVGTDKGAPIPVRDPSGMIVGYKRDKKGEVVMTRFSAEKLKEITQKVNGKFWGIGNGESEVEAFFKEMGALSQGERKDKRVRIREERFQIPLFFAVLILLLEFFTGKRARTRKLGVAILVCLFWLGGSPSAFSAESADLSIYLKNREALKALEKKEVGKAKELLSEAQLENPNLPELRYNQAEMHAAEGDNKKAGEVFRSTGDQASEMNRPDVSGLSYFNAGVVQGQKKELKTDAIQSYLRAIEKGKESKNEELVRHARKNLHFLLDPNQQGGGGGSDDQKKEDQEQKKDQNQESKSGKNESDGSEKSKDQSEKDSKDADKKKEMPENYDGVDQKKKFKSESLTPEAAEQVMSELSEKEKELQGKLQRRKDRPQSLEKDW